MSFRGLIEASGSQFVLIPAKVVPQLVQVGEANLVAENLAVCLRVVPEIFQVEYDLRRLGLVVAKRAAMGVAREKAEDVLGEALSEGINIRQGFVMNRYCIG